MQKCKNDCGYAIMQKMYFNYAVMQIKNGPICHYAETPQGALSVHVHLEVKKESIYVLRIKDCVYDIKSSSSQFQIA